MQNPSNGIELTDIETLAAYNVQLNLFLTVEAETPQIARESALGWLEETCKNAAEWREESEVIFDDDVDDDYEGDTYELAQFFSVTGVINAETGEDAT